MSEYKWFRFYNEVLNDPKVQLLDPILFRAWVNILCLTSMRGGKAPKQEIPFHLRAMACDTEKIVDSLVNAGLLIDNGESVTPHNWGARQYISDNGKERVKRHREKRKAMGLPAQNWIPQVTRNAVTSKCNSMCVYCGTSNDLTIDHITPQSRGGTNDISNLQLACRICNAKKRDLTHEEYLTRNNQVTLLVTTPEDRVQKQKQSREEIDKHTSDFEALWKSYPRKDGSKQKAKELYKKALKEGATHGQITDGVRRYAEKLRAEGTEQRFIAHCTTWLNGKRWEADYTIETKGNEWANAAEEYIATLGAGQGRIS